MLSGDDPNTLILNAYSSDLIGRIVTAEGHATYYSKTEDGIGKDIIGPNVHQIGPLADTYLPSLQSNYTPPEDVVEFIQKHQDAGEQIAAVGFGSMPYGQVEFLVNALVKCKVPGILIGTAMQSMKKIIEEKKGIKMTAAEAVAKDGKDVKDAT